MSTGLPDGAGACCLQALRATARQSNPVMRFGWFRVCMMCLLMGLVLLLRKDDLELTNGGPFAHDAGMNDVIEALRRSTVEQLAFSDLKGFAESAAEWNRPAFGSLSGPIRDDGRIALEVGAGIEVVVEDILGAHLIDLVDARAAEGPEVLKDHSASPGASGAIEQYC